jgi:hypothetical protein
VRPSKRPTAAEKALMKREMVGWRRFWTRYASQFKNLKKLTANVPEDIYEDWGKGELPALLSDERWQMLEVEEKNAGDHGFLGGYFPFHTTSSSSLRYSFAKRRSRTKFVQKVFFRLDDKPLELEIREPELTEKEREEGEITEEMIKDREMPSQVHRFWAKKDEEAMVEEKVAGEKRKRSEIAEGGVDGEELEVKRQKVARERHLLESSVNLAHEPPHEPQHPAY